MRGPSSRAFPLTGRQCLALLQTYTSSKSLRPAKPLHALVLTTGLLSSSPFLPSKLAVLYSLCGHLSYARHMFDKIPHKTTSLFDGLIRGHVDSGQHLDALRLFSQILPSGALPGNFTYAFALKACAELSLLKIGTHVHCLALASGFRSDEYVQNSLISMYMSCGCRVAAEMVFEGMGKRSVISWNAMISGYFRDGYAKEALEIFDRMVDAGVDIDQATVVSVLPACAHLKDLQRGRRLHELIVEKGFDRSVAVKNSLIDMYSKCRILPAARRIFDDEVLDRDVISWSAMIGGYVSNGRFVEALELSHSMQLSGVRPNVVTMASLLSACGSLPSVKHGKCVHGSCIRLGIGSELIVETALIDMYTKCGDMKFSSLMFSKGSRRTATWNAVISGFARRGKAQEAIGHFKQMLAEGVKPDLVTTASLIGAYADSSDLQQAKNLHSYLTRVGFLCSTMVATGLMDVYAKVGCLDVARELFDGLAVKDFVAWSAIIAGHGMHGCAKIAISFLNEMVKSGVEPNEVTFTSVLYSCSHAGLVDEGLELFERMARVHHLRPNVDHYACIVDLLGRSGRLDEAYGMITSMPFEANYAVWGALLGACVIHENVELGEVAAENLFQLEPDNTGNYVLLGKIYAAVGRWEDAEAARSMVIDRGLQKAPGCSLLEARNL